MQKNQIYKKAENAPKYINQNMVTPSGYSNIDHKQNDDNNEQSTASTKSESQQNNITFDYEQKSQSTEIHNIQQYHHHSEFIMIENCITSNKRIDKRRIELPKGSWKKKLDEVNKEITGFNIHKDIKWKLSINNETIEPNDVNGFEQILSSMPPPITIKIIKVRIFLSISLLRNTFLRYKKRTDCK